MNGGSLTNNQLAAAQQALQAGDPARAKSLLLGDQAAGSALPRDGEWLLARAEALLGNRPAEREALHRILAHNRRDLPALLVMGESFALAGEERTAISWFTTAINQAAATGAPPGVAPLIDRARVYCQQTQQRFAARLDQGIRDALGAGPAAASDAIRHAIDIVQGRAQLYLQQPTMFYYPGLPQRGFYERREFDWVAAFEAQAPVMRDELLSLLADADCFAPYVQRRADQPASSSPLLEDPSWGAAYLWRNGNRDEQLATRCPATLAALEAVPKPLIAGRSPMALYSRLRGGTHIAPHHGLLNTRLICHLPLIVPEGCGLRVGHETREWQFGEMLIFDDSVEHEAWNRGTEDRIVLLFEIWRPEIPAADREALVKIFEVIDANGPVMQDEGA